MSQNEEEDQETDTCSKDRLLFRTFVNLKALIDAVCTVKLGQTALSKRARTTTNITYFQTAAGGSLRERGKGVDILEFSIIAGKK